LYFGKIFEKTKNKEDVSGPKLLTLLNCEAHH